MYIKHLRVENFRNYRFAEIDLSPETNIFYGNNAQGKTNILEACYLFSHGRSHRAKYDTELIRFGENLFTVKMVFADSEREYSADIKINKESKKAIRINNVPITKLSELMSYLNVVMFEPDDLELIKGSPTARRRFVDEALSQLYPNYLVNLINYNKTLLQKNALLKSLRANGAKGDPMLSAWNEQLAIYGTAVTKYRREFLEKLSVYAEKIHAEIARESFSLSYQPNIPVGEGDDIKAEFLKKLEASAEREIETGLSQHGIQRDDFKVMVDGNEARIYGSQGQQRTCVLTLKLAQTEHIKSIKGEYPVLLLDDIMSELDINRRRYLSEKIRDKQVLITCTDIDDIEKDAKGRIFKISNGTISK